jgi:6-phosphofructokinase 1
MEAVKALIDGVSGVMVGQIHNNISYTPFEKATKHHITVNPLLIDMVNILA